MSNSKAQSRVIVAPPVAAAHTPMPISAAFVGSMGIGFAGVAGFAWSAGDYAMTLIMAALAMGSVLFALAFEA